MDLGAETIFYVNEYEHTLDKQGRVAIPASWRGADGSARFILLPSSDFSLKLMPFALFKETVLDKIKQLSLADTRHARDLAILGSSAQECVCDKQGRIQIGQKLLDHAGLRDRVSLVGAIGYIQLWSPERWEAGKTGKDECYEVLEKISQYDAGGSR